MPGIRPLSTAYHPALPGFAGPKTYAAWPVWAGSVAKEIKLQPMPKKAATKLWHRARDFDRQTHQAGKHGGAVGHSALQVLHAMLFDFLNYASGRLGPSYAAIARKANVCERTVATAIKRLRDLGILNWVRRCAEGRKDGRFVLGVGARFVQNRTPSENVSLISGMRNVRLRKKSPKTAAESGDFPFSTLFQNASERQRNFEQAASVRFWTNRAATPPSAAWAQMSAI